MRSARPPSKRSMRALAAIVPQRLRARRPGAVKLPYRRSAQPHQSDSTAAHVRSQHRDRDRRRCGSRRRRRRGAAAATACWAITAPRRLGVQPGRADDALDLGRLRRNRRPDLVDPGAPAARLDQQRHVEDHGRPGGRRAAAWRSVSSPISGWRIASRRRARLAVGEGQSHACAARSRAPSASMKSAPKAAAMAAIAAPPGCVSSRAISVGVDHHVRRARRAARRRCSCRCRCRRSARCAALPWRALVRPSRASPGRAAARRACTTRPAPARNGPNGHVAALAQRRPMSFIAMPTTAPITDGAEDDRQDHLDARARRRARRAA